MDSKRKFRFKLAGHLGMTVSELETRMHVIELEEWYEYSLEEPLISDRLELMLAQVISSLAGIPSFEAMITLSEDDKKRERQRQLNLKISQSLGA